MSFETDELKAQIIRRFKDQLNALGIVNIELIVDSKTTLTPQKTGSAIRTRVMQICRWLTSSVMIRACEVVLLLSVLPTIVSNFRLNYDAPLKNTMAYVSSVSSFLATEPLPVDPLAPLLPTSPQMAVSDAPAPEAPARQEPCFKTDLRRCNRTRSHRPA